MIDYIIYHWLYDFFFKMKSSDDGRDEFSGVAWKLSGTQHSRWGAKFIPPARNSEWKCSGEWLCASLWWYHEAMLTRRSQTSWGDVDCYKWVEVGGCWAGSWRMCKHSSQKGSDGNQNWDILGPSLRSLLPRSYNATKWSSPGVSKPVPGWILSSRV